MYKQSYSWRACFTIHAFKHSKEGSTKQPHCWTWCDSEVAMGRVSASLTLRDWTMHTVTPNFDIKRRQAIMQLVFCKRPYWRVSTYIKNKVEKFKNECWKNLLALLAWLALLCKGYGLGFFAGTLVTAYAAQIFSPRQIACCSPGGIKYAKLIKHKAFGMPRLPSGVFCSFRSGRSL